MRGPERVEVFGADGADAGAAEVRFASGEALRVEVTPRRPVTRLVLSWEGGVPEGTRILNDAWERGYGDLEWRGIVPERVLPWMFLATGPQGHRGLGVRTGAGSLASWRVTADRIELTLDLRAGGAPLEPSGRSILAAEVGELTGGPDEELFDFAHRFCRALCPNPRLPVTPVYGGNDWYYAYGENSHASIAGDARLLAELTEGLSHRPFMVIDAGWFPAKGVNGGPYLGNEHFPDMAGLAAEMRSVGVRPGIWMRPLKRKDAPREWQLPADHPVQGREPGVFLDPTVPEVLQQVREDVALIAGWGYELIKHDFTTFDLTGKWGFEMEGGRVTPDGWGFRDRTRTTAEVITALYGVIREAAGDALLIGCNTVGHLAAGTHELQRTGDDTSGREWERTRKMGVNTLAMRMPQHGAFFHCDADCVGLTREVPWELNARWLEVLSESGTPLFVSADPRAVGSEQREALRGAFALASTPRPVSRPLDWTSTTCPTRWRSSEGERRYAWERGGVLQGGRSSVRNPSRSAAMIRGPRGRRGAGGPDGVSGSPDGGPGSPDGGADGGQEPFPRYGRLAETGVSRRRDLGRGRLVHADVGKNQPPPPISIPKRPVARPWFVGRVDVGVSGDRTGCRVRRTGDKNHSPATGGWWRTPVSPAVSPELCGQISRLKSRPAVGKNENVMAGYVTAQEAVSVIKSGDNVFLHGMGAFPQVLVDAMVQRADELKGVQLFHLHTEGDAKYALPEYKESFFVNNLFIGANTRGTLASGQGDYIPMFLSEIPSAFRKGVIKLDVALMQVSPPDKHGYVSLGVSVDAALAAMQSAKVAIAQVNEHMPRTHGDGQVHISNFKFLVEGNRPLVEHAAPAPNEVEMEIGKRIAAIIDDGATLQMGIGSIPNAVLAALTGHKKLGIHTEMFSDGVVELVEKGVITNCQKPVRRGKIVAGFVSGSKRLYEFVDDNPNVQMLDISFVNDTSVIRRLPKMTAINSAIEVDLTGQICADSIGTRMFSGVGGQMDFVRGASLSEGGKPIFAISSTAKKGMSRIVPTLKEGAGVVTTRAHVHYVATEYGIADLYGKNLGQRAKALIEIAHPDCREELERAAYERFKH